MDSYQRESKREGRREKLSVSSNNRQYLIASSGSHKSEENKQGTSWIRRKITIDEGEGWSRYALSYDPLAIGSIDGTDTEPHDKGIVRALSANYEPNRHVGGNPHSTLFIGRLPKQFNQDEIIQKFSKFGKIKNFRFVKDIITGSFRGYGFIEYKHEADATYAYVKAKNTVINGKEIIVDMEQERILPGWVPRRLGGGFGGKKESGQLRFGCRDRPFRKPYSMLDL